MTKLVGILNITPDSFSDGGHFLVPEAAVKHAERLFADGADWVDLGAESTRPGATPLSHEQEWMRLEPVLKSLLPTYSGRLSIDSYHPKTIEKALQRGDIIVNDVSGLSDPAMRQLVIERKPRVIINHIPGGDIHTVHNHEPLRSIEPIIEDLSSVARELEAAGLEREKIILDPGIGFGKTPELNRRLLSFAADVPDYQVMIGYSRKRFLGEDRMELAPNLDAGKIAISSGAAYLRVHDVAGHRRHLFADK